MNYMVVMASVAAVVNGTDRWRVLVSHTQRTFGRLQEAQEQHIAMPA